ncbi:MAG TPA: hypothetical protein VK881_16070, partial [bacterium]|nr:hypothetical protein [bacterium]
RSTAENSCLWSPALSSLIVKKRGLSIAYGLKTKAGSVANGTFASFSASLASAWDLSTSRNSRAGDGCPRAFRLL